MKEALSLTIVSGPNASGKTTLVKNNEQTLLKNNFAIILPDEILKYATSLTDRVEVIGEHIDNAITAKKNILIETPFQNEAFISRVEEIKKLGYETSLYQVYLSNVKESINRVEDRFKKGGLYISDEQVFENFHANLKSISNIFYKFNHAYFINNTGKEKYTLTAHFKVGVLAMLKTSNADYLKQLFTTSARKGLLTASEIKIINANKNYVNESLAPKKNRSRLKF